jgi:hypothetical protein
MSTYPSGVDFSTFPNSESIVVNGRTYYGGPADMDSSFTTITGARAVLEHIARRLITPPGQYDDPSYGFDINTYLNANLLPQETSALQAAVANQAVEVEGVDDVAVSVTLADNRLLISIDVILIDSVEGFNFIFVLSADTIPRIYFPSTPTI